MPAHVRTQTIWRDDPVPVKATRAPMLAVIAALLLLVIAMTLAARFPHAARVVPWYVYALLLLVVVVLRIRQIFRQPTISHRARREQRARVTALIAAYGRCGACGYDLTDIPPNVDGCARCPECNAAWNLDRATMRACDPRTDPVLARHLRWSVLYGQHPLSDDDRGVPLDSPSFRFRRWLRSDRRGRAFWGPRLAPRRESRSWLMGWVIRATLTLWMLANAGVVATHPMHRLTMIEMLGLAVLSGVIAIAVVIVAWRSGSPVEWARDLILTARVCPNCHDDLPDPRYVHPTLDGCTACATCGRAWRLPPTNPGTSTS